MAKLLNGYRRLQGRDASLLHRSELWLGADHLLRVDLQGITESYRRFYFGDIQAIIVRPTTRWLGEAIVSGVLLALFLVFALLNDEVWRWFWLGLSGLVLPFTLVTLLRGATCECYLKTAVQTDRLTSLKRVRAARKFIATVQPLIDQAQGTMSTAEYQHRLQSLAAPTSALPPAITSAQRRASVAPVIRHSQGRAHALLCLLLLGQVIISGVDLFIENSKLNTGSVVLFFMMLILCVVTIIRQSNTNLPVGLKRLAWMILACYIAWAILGIGYSITSLIARPMAGHVRPTEENDPIAFILTASMALCSFALALSGLLMLRRWWQAGRPAPPELPTPPGA